MRRTKLNLNLNENQIKALDYLENYILYISEEIKQQIPRDVWSNIVNTSQDALPYEEECLQDQGYLVLKNKAEYYLGEAGFLVDLSSGNIRYLLTNLKENGGRVWSLEKLERINNNDDWVSARNESSSIDENADDLRPIEEINDAIDHDAEEDNEFDDDENICTNCGGMGRIIVNREGQAMTESSPAYVYERAGGKVCPACDGTGRHLGIMD